jgi:mannose-1-phosphate guanylyltransferase
MNGTRQTWVVILAGGEGTRLAALTADSDGNHVPKQFCSLANGGSLLDDALSRAERVTSLDHILVIVAREHRRWWGPIVAHLPKDNVIVQPCNRGTGNGVLLTLLHVRHRDPDATLVFLPADHFVRDEHAISQSIHEAIEWLSDQPGQVLLLGITPDDPDPELGYIVPAETGSGRVLPVREFVEKPNPAFARKLLSRGSVWNSFIFAAQASALMVMLMRRHHRVMHAVRLALERENWPARGGETVAATYEALPIIDFSRHVVEGAEDMLHVLPVPACGWTDLGTPQRVGQCVIRLAFERHAPRAREVPYLSLATAFARQRLAV